MQLDSNILAEFKKITGKDISLYISNAVTFFSGDYNTIVNYYSGYSDSITSIPFTNFKTLQQQNKDIMEAFKEHSKRFNNLKWFLLIEQIEEIDSRLATLSKINKWARSSITKVAYDPSIQIDYVLKQNQTLEAIAGNNDDWVGIAVKNNLTEEDYTTAGGTEVKLSLNKINGGFRINSVVDVMQGKAIYGKDLSKKFQFVKEDGYLNLKVLGYDDTIHQAAYILANLKKNDNPDNPNNGLQTSLVAGTNRALFNFPVIIRQMSQTFANDDTLKNFKITNLVRDQDVMKMEFQVSTRLGEIISDTTSL